MQRIILPIAYEFDPDLVLVSAGFDAAVGDPLGGCRVTPEAFGHFTAWLAALAGGRCVVCLEGGYNVESVAMAMVMCAKALLGDPLPALQTAHAGRAAPAPAPARSGAVALSAAAQSCVQTLHEVWSVQAEHWQALRGWHVRVPEKYAPEAAAGAAAETAASVDGLASALGAIDLNTAAAAAVEVAEKQDTEDNEDNEDNGDEDDGDEAGGAVGGGSAAVAVAAVGASAPGSSRQAPPVRTLSSFLAENLHEFQTTEMYAVYPRRDCPHLRTLPAAEDGGKIGECSGGRSLDICLECG